MKHIDDTYPRRLQEIGVLLLEDYKGAKQHHNVKCAVCDNVWNTTPVFIIRTNKKFNANGCPKCKRKREQSRFQESRTKNIQKLKDRGFEIISDWNGSRRIDKKRPTLVTVKNTRCGHTFEATAMNLLFRTECSVCGPQKRAEKGITKWSKENSRIWQETATEWQQYKSKVAALTRRVYTKHKSTVNPNSLPRGKAGQPGAYHVDHIVPIRFCFENNIPPQVCSHYTNLQMLYWHANVGSRDKLKVNAPIPAIFDKYFNDDY